MSRATIRRLSLLLQTLLTAVFALLAIACLLVSLLWRDRVALDDILLPAAPLATRDSNATVTWFGVSTLLFDDGETQILIDGFVSRPAVTTILFDRPVESDVATINYFLNEYDVSRLAAIIPTHSHYDHAMDIGAIANRTSASILGSESTANIGRGASVPEDQLLVIDENTDYEFGNFSVRFIDSPHAPIGSRGSVPFAGTIPVPLLRPAPVSSYREGGSYSLVVTHPSGSVLVQGSAGFSASALAGVHVDMVFLGVGMLESLGRQYMAQYWQTLVTATGARTVIPVHFDDYTRPFGEILLAPRILDDFSVTVRVLKELRTTWDQDTRIYLPNFATPIPILPGAVSAT